VLLDATEGRRKDVLEDVQDSQGGVLGRTRTLAFGR